ncbi:MAG: hypothetical protein HY268_10340 [Deltaproteobacteria bacterium]|nr:hypothetical protein [Deltaproteobacteria bacterium]
MNDCGVRYCCICGKRFEPHPRLGAQQRTCGGADCQRQRRRANTRTWRAQYPDEDDTLCRRARQRDRHCYHRRYWATHPKRRRYHADYMRLWRARRKAFATPSVSNPYRDIQVKLPAVNTYLKVMSVSNANRVITAKLLSAQDLIATTPA